MIQCIEGDATQLFFDYKQCPNDATQIMISDAYFGILVPLCDYHADVWTRLEGELNTEIYPIDELDMVIKDANYIVSHLRERLSKTLNELDAQREEFELYKADHSE